MVGPTELGQSEERLREKMEMLKISTQKSEEGDISTVSLF